MTVNIPTLLAYTATLFALMGGLLLTFWVKEGRTRWLLWCTLPFIMGCCASVLLVEPSLLPGRWAGRLAVVFVLLAYGLAWQAIRGFYGRSPVTGCVILIVAPWLLFSATVVEPWGLEVASAALRAFIVVVFNGLAAYEFWRGRSEALSSRAVLFGIFVAYALIAALRVPLASYLPMPLGAAPTQVWAVIAYNLSVVTQALLVATFMVALSRERIALQNYRLATRDPLTGVFNRRAFDEQADKLAQTSQETGAPLTLLLFDLDHFKTINDRFGHDIGDKVIQRAAQTARQVLRQQDTVFRVGGEEFVCLLPGTSADQAFMIAERLRRAFQAATEDVSGEIVRATLSIGLASTDMIQWRVQHLLARADAALYEAKRSGRNRSVLSRFSVAAETVLAPPTIPFPEAS